MQPTNPFAKSVSWNFRSSTREQEQAHIEAPSPRNRHELSPTSTPTLVRSPMHDCQQINPENTQVKIVQRIWNTYFRMQVAFVFRCHTWRGTTKFNGSVAHCDCQAAHSSLAPTLYDDKLRRVTSTILEDGFDALSPTSEKYICHRFELDTPQKALLSQEEISERHLQKLLQSLTLRQKKGSYVDTNMEKNRNATFQNPAESNRLDSHLEHHLRPLEDRLADECKNQNKIPLVCTQELVVEHLKLLDEAIQNISIRLAQFELFTSSHEQLHIHITSLLSLTPENMTEKLCEDFITTARKFLSAKEALIKHLPGAPHLNDFVNFYLIKTPFYTLRGLSKDFDKLPLEDFCEKLMRILPSIQLFSNTQRFLSQKNRHSKSP